MLKGVLQCLQKTRLHDGILMASNVFLKDDPHVFAIDEASQGYTDTVTERGRNHGLLGIDPYRFRGFVEYIVSSANGANLNKIPEAEQARVKSYAEALGRMTAAEVTDECCYIRLKEIFKSEKIRLEISLSNCVVGRELKGYLGAVCEIR